MIYLLDTNACIVFLNQRSTGVLRKLRTVPAANVAICSIVKAELFYGAAKSRRPAETLARQREFLDQFVSLAFDDRAAEVYGQVRASLEEAGMPIGSNDLLIASVAMANGLVLVTANAREFGRIAGLRYEDWEADNQ